LQSLFYIKVIHFPDAIPNYMSLMKTGRS